MKEEHVVFIGSKPVINYCLATMTAINNSGGRAVLRTRGKAIANAVSVAEVLRNRFMDGIEVGDIKISTVELEGVDGSMRNVSTIEIELKQAR